MPQIIQFVSIGCTIWILLYILHSTSPNKTLHTPTHSSLISFPFWSPSFLTPALGFCSLYQIFYIWYLHCQNYKKFNRKFGIVERDQASIRILTLLQTTVVSCEPSESLWALNHLKSGITSPLRALLRYDVKSVHSAWFTTDTYVSAFNTKSVTLSEDFVVWGVELYNENVTVLSTNF